MISNQVMIDRVIPEPQIGHNQEKYYDNIRAAMKLSVPFLHTIPGYCEPKQGQIALIGGGPSLGENIQGIRDFSGPTVACGTCYDYILYHGVIPNYSVICDPDPIVLNYIKGANKNTIFFIATSCDPSVFERLNGYMVYKWHCYNDQHDKYSEIDPGFSAIGGGCTVGLRTLTIAMLMGYRDIHFYGFDSCIGKNGGHYAYDYSTPEEVSEKTYQIKLDPNKDEYYTCLGYHLAQADNFRDFTIRYFDHYRCWFHGGGMLSEMYDIVDYQIRKGKLQTLRNSKRNDSNGTS